MGSTKVELVKDLLAELKNPMPKEISDAIAQLAIRAEQGKYHYFESDLATPKMQLHSELQTLGLYEIDKKMQNGDYDDESASPEEKKRLLDLLTDEKEKI